MTIHPRAIAEQAFAKASAQAARFELRVRLRGGAVPQTSTLPIDARLADVRDALLAHYASVRTADETTLVEKACTIRNKLLHCELSAARARLAELGPRTRKGGVYSVDVQGLAGSDIEAKLAALATGSEEGKVYVANTKTRQLKDVYGWLLESFGAGEFAEAAEVFERAMGVLDTWAATEDA